MRLVFIFFYFLFALKLCAQENQDSFKKRNLQNVQFALKGIVLPYLLGNGSGVSNNLGVELFFAKKHSFGINGVYHFSGGSHDMVTDTAGIKHDIGQYYRNREKAFVINYRYYLNLNNFVEKKRKTFYASIICRYGKTSRFDDPAYKTYYISQYETKTTFALAIGMLYRLKNLSKWGIDVNIGVANRNLNTDTEYRENRIVKYKSESRNRLGVWVGLTFGYYFFKNN